jgi:hypothetical protein
MKKDINHNNDITPFEVSFSDSGKNCDVVGAKH